MSGQHAGDGLGPADLTAVIPAAPESTPGQEAQAPAVPFGARAATPPVSSCRCPDCKYGRRPCTDFVLYAGPDAMTLMINSAIRDGRYEDLDADYAAKVHGVHADFDAAGHRARRTLGPAIQAWQRWRAAEAVKAAERAVAA